MTEQIAQSSRQEVTSVQEPLNEGIAAQQELEILMNAAWPGLETDELDGWLLRSAGSVTQRANSVWSRTGSPASKAKLELATSWYSQRRQPVIFQILRNQANSRLEELLDQAGYSSQSETLIMTLTAGNPKLPAGSETFASDSPQHHINVEISQVLSQEWLDTSWAVEGRGGDAAKSIAREILESVPSLHASARDEQGHVVGTARLTVLGEWAGVYSVAVLESARRRGIAKQLTNALLDAGHEHGANKFWLLVTAANAGAQQLYSSLGFEEVAKYHYRQAPLRRAPGAC